MAMAASRALRLSSPDRNHGAEPVSFTQQPCLPAGPELPHSGKPCLIYLDVWQREVTGVEDFDLADPAFEAADTTTRIQTVWQVKLREVSSAGARRTLEEDCKFAPSASRLSTAPAGYTGGENHLQRVEVHDKGRAGTATFKWSRDNASTVARVTRLTDLSHIVAQAFGVPLWGFSGGDLIEITDDAREFAGHPGELRRIKSIDAGSSTFTLDTPLSSGLFRTDQNGAPDVTSHMRVRRWEGTGAIQGPSWIGLENGIAVRFEANAADRCFRTGGYWLIPARVANRLIEPLDRAPPRGIHHHFVKLALFTLPRGLRDLRGLVKR